MSSQVPHPAPRPFFAGSNSRQPTLWRGLAFSWAAAVNPLALCTPTGVLYGVVNGTTPIVPGPAGPAIRADANGDGITFPDTDGSADHVTKRNQFPLAYEAIFVLNSQPASTRPIIGTSHQTSVYSGITIYGHNDDNLFLNFGRGSGTTGGDRRSHITPSGSVPAGRLIHLLVVARAIDDADVYINGQQVTPTVSGTANSMDHNAPGIRIGGQASVNSTGDATIYLFQRWNRLLSHGEVQRRMRDPWGMFVSRFPGRAGFFGITGGNSGHTVLQANGVPGVLVTQASVEVLCDVEIRARATQVTAEVLHSVDVSTPTTDCDCAVEIAHPFAEDELEDLQWAQKDDLLYIGHPKHELRKLTRLSENSFSFAAVEWSDGRAPMLTPNIDESKSILATQVGGDTYTLKANFDAFELLSGHGDTHVGRYVRLSGTAASESSFVGETGPIAGDPDDPDNSDPSETDPFHRNDISAYRFPVFKSGTISQIEVYFSTPYTGNIRGGIYNDSLQLQEESDEVAVNIAASQWVVIPLQDTVEVSAGDQIWLAAIIDEDPGEEETSIRVHQPSAPTNTNRRRVDVTYGALPSVLGAGSTEIDPMMFRAPLLESGDDTDAWFRITSRTDDRTVTAELVSGTAPSGYTDDWALGATSFTMGPRAIAFHEGRMVLGGFPLAPDRVILSDSGNFERFTEGSESDNAIARTASAGRVDDVQWITSLGGVLWIGTRGTEFALVSNEEILTPTSAQIKPHSARGSAHLMPAVIGREIVFLQEGDKKLRLLTSVSGSPDAVELSILHEHITGTGIREMAYQQDPDSVLWMVREDGELVAMTIETVQLVTAAHRHLIGGSFSNGDAVVESVAVAGGWPYLIVKRTINGSTVRYIEQMQSRFEPRRTAGWKGTKIQRTRAVRDAWFLDSALEYDGNPINISNITQANPGVVTTAEDHGLSNGDQVLLNEIGGMTELEYAVAKVANKTDNTFELTDTDDANIDTSAFTAYTSGGVVRLMDDTFDGLDHLEGETLGVLADGVPQDDATVSSGSITLGAKHAIIRVGLSYDTVVETQRFTHGRLGTGQGQRHRVQRASARFVDTTSVKIGTGPDPNTLETYSFDEAKFSPDVSGAAIATPLFSGDKEVPIASRWSSVPTIYMKVDEPLPMTVLCLMPRNEVGER